MIDFVDTGLSANSVSDLSVLEEPRAKHAAVEGRAPAPAHPLAPPRVRTAGRRVAPHEQLQGGTTVGDADDAFDLAFASAFDSCRARRALWTAPPDDRPTAQHTRQELALAA